MKRRTVRRGVTILEVVIVVAVLAVLATLTLSAVQMAREAARRGGCVNNLRQVGLALGNYVAATGAFPPGNAGRHAYSFHASCLPYSDNVALYNAINFGLTTNELRPTDANYTAMHVQVGYLLCPSDPPAGGGVARVSYAGNAGGGVPKYGWNGLFSPPSVATIAPRDVLDGLSATAAVAEWALGAKGSGSWERKRAVFQTPRRLLKPEEFERFVALCRDPDDPFMPELPEGKGENWIRGDFADTLYNHAMNINGPSCTNDGYVQEGAWTAGSAHAAGAHLLFGDGHVKFVKESVATETWRALGSRNGGEIISGESL